MDEILQDFSPSVVAHAIDTNHIAYQSLFSTLPGAELYDVGGVRWFTTGLPHDTFNGVLQMRVKSDELNAAIDRVRTFFEQHNLPFLWPLGSASHPLNCGPALQTGGLTFVEEEPEMAVDLHALNEDIQVSSRMTVHGVTNREQLMQWMRVWLFPVPEDIIQQFFLVYTHFCLGTHSPLHLYLGMLDGKPVATVALFFGAGVAAIHHVVTLPEVRGQGIGGTMTFMAAREARAAGYRIGVLTASPMGINIYRRLGFSEYGTLSWYLWHPTNGK